MLCIPMPSYNWAILREVTKTEPCCATNASVSQEKLFPFRGLVSFWFIHPQFFHLPDFCSCFFMLRPAYDGAALQIAFSYSIVLVYLQHFAGSLQLIPNYIGLKFWVPFGLLPPLRLSSDEFSPSLILRLLLFLTWTVSSSHSQKILHIIMKLQHRDSLLAIIAQLGSLIIPSDSIQGG